MRSNEIRVAIAPDTPGYGGSDAPPAPPTIPDYADAVVALVADGALAAGPFDLMGYHTGGVIAACLARRLPDRVRRLIFVSLAALDAEARQQRLAGMDRFPVPRTDALNIAEMWALNESLNDRRLDPEWRHRALDECLSADTSCRGAFARSTCTIAWPISPRSLNQR